jgi:hypothetical protein
MLHRDPLRLFARQHVVQDGELSEELVDGLGEEAREHHERPGPFALLAYLLDHREIVVRTEAGVVERVIEHQAPVVVLRAAEHLRRRATDVGEADVPLAHRPAPVVDLVVLAPVPGRIEPQVLEQDVAHDLLPSARRVGIARLLQDRLEVHPGDVDIDAGIGLRADVKLPERARIVAQARRRGHRLGSRDHRPEGAVVELNEASHSQSLERARRRREGRQEQRLDEPVIGAAGHLRTPRAAERRAVLRAEALASDGGRRAVRLLDHREQLVGVELPRLLEVRAHDPVGRVVAPREHVKQIPHRDHFADGEVRDVLDEELHQEANRRAIALERVR